MRMRLLPLVLLLALPVALPAQHTYTPADIQEGGRLFRVNCVLCHGPEGDQVPGIDLGHGRFRQTYSENALVKISEDMLIHRAAVDKLIADVKALKSKNPKMGVGEFKDLTGVSRKFAIPLLEYLDRQRVTRRVGDERMIL